jgi:hypothetical protein
MTSTYHTSHNAKTAHQVRAGFSVRADRVGSLMPGAWSAVRTMRTAIVDADRTCDALAARCAG